MGAQNTPSLLPNHQSLGLMCSVGDDDIEDDVIVGDQPLKNIAEPHENDVLFGRGGGTNHHSGNKRWRKLVTDRELEYYQCKRMEKPRVALEIVRLVHQLSPPGRFLKKDPKTGLWNDCGDKKAREKTSQALRERAPLIKETMEREGELVAPPPLATILKDELRQAKLSSPVLPSKEMDPDDDFTFDLPLLPEPFDSMKRETSYQYETTECKPDLLGGSVKRAAINRDNSRAANRLKEEQGYPVSRQYMDDDGVRELSMTMAQASLETSGLEPRPLSDEPRMTTIDFIANDLMFKRQNGRGTSAFLSSDMEELGMDLENDPVCRPPSEERASSGETGCDAKPMAKESTIDQIMNDLRVKPVSMASSSRVNTIDALNLDFGRESSVSSTTRGMLEALVDGVPADSDVSYSARLSTEDLYVMVNEPILEMNEGSENGGEDDEIALASV